MNNSSTGGYLQPATPALPRNLTFTQFLQTVLAGVSGFDGSLVRPEWQQKPPKQPDIDVNWLVFGVSDSEAMGFPYQGNVTVGSTTTFQTQYHEKVTLQCSMYGPEALENFRLLRDGLYMTQNNEALVSANFGLIGISKGVRAPELIDERWFNKWVFQIGLYYEQQRTYPVLTFLSAGGKAWIPVTTNNNFSVSWLASA